MNLVQKGVAVWVSNFYVWLYATAALNSCIQLQPQLHKRCKEVIVTSRCKAVSFMLETYVKHGFKDEPESNTMVDTQQSNKLHKEYPGALCNNTDRCNKLYDQYVLKAYLLLD